MKSREWHKLSFPINSRSSRYISLPSSLLRFTNMSFFIAPVNPDAERLLREFDAHLVELNTLATLIPLDGASSVVDMETWCADWDEFLVSGSVVSVSYFYFRFANFPVFFLDKFWRVPGRSDGEARRPPFDCRYWREGRPMRRRVSARAGCYRRRSEGGCRI